MFAQPIDIDMQNDLLIMDWNALSKNSIMEIFLDSRDLECPHSYNLQQNIHFDGYMPADILTFMKYFNERKPCGHSEAKIVVPRSGLHQGERIVKIPVKGDSIWTFFIRRLYRPDGSFIIVMEMIPGIFDVTSCGIPPLRFHVPNDYRPLKSGRGPDKKMSKRRTNMSGFTNLLPPSPPSLSNDSDFRLESDDEMPNPRRGNPSGRDMICSKAVVSDMPSLEEINTKYINVNIPIHKPSAIPRERTGIEELAMRCVDMKTDLMINTVSSRYSPYNVPTRLIPRRGILMRKMKHLPDFIEVEDSSLTPPPQMSEP